MADPNEWLSPGQLDWARRQSEARNLPDGWLAQDLANRQRFGLTQDPNYEMSQSEYDEVIENTEESRDIAVDSSSARPTPGNVRITAPLEALLGSCATLGCLQPPVDGYGGGAHGCMRQPSGDGLDSHHMPADRYSPIPREMAPAIQMDPHDHTQTDSYGGGVHGPRYAGRQALLARGLTMAVFNRDAAEIEQKFPGKYTASIAQARAYAECLRQAGVMR